MPVTRSEMGESSQHASLRPVVAAMDADVSRLARGAPSDAGAGIARLLQSWADLVETLALGPAPEMRECPTCRHQGLRAGTRCGFCRTILKPLAAAGDGQRGHLGSTEAER